MSFEIPYNFSARSYQKEMVDAKRRGINHLVSVWHRRAGKDKFWINFCIAEALINPGNYYYTLPTYKQAKQNVWINTDDDGRPFMFHHIPPELITNKNATELAVELKNGSRIQLIGTDNTDLIRGPNPRGIVFSEYSVQDPAAYSVLQPILMANQGWVAFNFTPKGQNHAYKLFEAYKDDPEWFFSIKTIDDTRRDAPGERRFGTQIVTAAQIDKEMRQRGVAEDFIQQEFYCSFNGYMAGAFYSDLLKKMRSDGCVRDCAWNPGLPVFTVWDLGIFDAMACIYAQWQENWLVILDYKEWRGVGLNACIKDVLNRDYNYSAHYAPHDINQRELTSGRTRKEIAREFGINFRTVENLSVQDGIDSVRTMLPRTKIDGKRAARLIECLENYHREQLDEEGREFGEKPVHDWSSHGADAARYLSIVFEREKQGRQQNVQATGLDSDPFDNGPYIDSEAETEW